MSEVFLIFFVLGLWLSAIGFCLNQYKSLRRLETQVHYCVSRKDPLNIGEIKIVAREQDSIIYKKKRYSTLMDTQIEDEELKNMHYVQEYLPKNYKTMPSTISALVVGHDDLTGNIPLTATRSRSTTHNSTASTYIPLTTHTELVEEQQPLSAPPTTLTSFVLFDADIQRPDQRMVSVQRTGKRSIYRAFFLGLHILLFCRLLHKHSEEEDDEGKTKDPPIFFFFFAFY